MKIRPLKVLRKSPTTNLLMDIYPQGTKVDKDEVAEYYADLSKGNGKKTKKRTGIKCRRRMKGRRLHKQLVASGYWK